VNRFSGYYSSAGGSFVHFRSGCRRLNCRGGPLPDMYAVVGCSECSNLWIIEGRSDTTQCPRCGSRKGYEKRKKFVETDDAAHARDVRASMLANRQGRAKPSRNSTPSPTSRTTWRTASSTTRSTSRDQDWMWRKSRRPATAIRAGPPAAAASRRSSRGARGPRTADRGRGRRVRG